MFKTLVLRAKETKKRGPDFFNKFLIKFFFKILLRLKKMLIRLLHLFTFLLNCLFLSYLFLIKDDTECNNHGSGKKIKRKRKLPMISTLNHDVVGYIIKIMYQNEMFSDIVSFMECSKGTYSIAKNALEGLNFHEELVIKSFKEKDLKAHSTLVFLCMAIRYMVANPMFKKKISVEELLQKTDIPPMKHKRRSINLLNMEERDCEEIIYGKITPSYEHIREGFLEEILEEDDDDTTFVRCPTYYLSKLSMFCLDEEKIFKFDKDEEGILKDVFSICIIHVILYDLKSFMKKKSPTIPIIKGNKITISLGLDGFGHHDLLDFVLKSNQINLRKYYIVYYDNCLIYTSIEEAFHTTILYEIYPYFHMGKLFFVSSFKPKKIPQENPLFKYTLTNVAFSKWKIHEKKVPYDNNETIE
jgi:hypothetical protein